MRKENTHSATAATASMDVSDIVLAEILSLLKIHAEVVLRRRRHVYTNRRHDRGAFVIRHLCTQFGEVWRECEVGFLMCTYTNERNLCRYKIQSARSIPFRGLTARHAH